MIPYICDHARGMMFVDGENLAIRYGKALAAKNRTPFNNTSHEPDTYVWSPNLNHAHGTPAIMRKYYYTVVQGDDVKLADTEEKLKALGMEAPRVFKKDKGKGSKRVDITLATDMLLHATRKHYDFAILIAGDEDYVPLVKAVQGEGARVHVWFISDGMSRALRMAADHFTDLDIHLFQ
jgi:uncharacterized LabA/DUF88 family protein